MRSTLPFISVRSFASLMGLKYLRNLQYASLFDQKRETINERRETTRLSIVELFFCAAFLVIQKMSRAAEHRREKRVKYSRNKRAEGKNQEKSVSSSSKRRWLLSREKN